jgi:hypothetical protein
VTGGSFYVLLQQDYIAVVLYTPKNFTVQSPWRP